MQQDYEKAKKLGERAYRKAVISGEYPYLPALGSMVQNVDQYAVRGLGVKEIPLEMIVGTRTAGRQNAFSSNFMPLLREDTEFAMKWSSLYDSASKEGIREAIKVYEFMNRFYVEEGNKRVSVSKYIGYVSIIGDVSRILPPKTNDLQSRIYYEYIDFYNVTGIFDITFSEAGSYAKLASLLGQNLTDPWPDSVLENLKASFSVFCRCFKAKSGLRLTITPGDAFLLYIEVFGMEGLMQDSSSAIENRIVRLWNEYLTEMNTGAKVMLLKTPEDTGKGSGVRTLMNLNNAFTTKAIRVAFLFDRNAGESSWVYGHELGANELVEQFDGAVEAIKFENLKSEEDIDDAFDACAADREDIVFATSPALMKGCLRAAIKYPKMRIMNCSINMKHNAVATYYPRMYEAKFLMGALAAMISDSHVIGYRADYPINGAIANINAFAQGVAWIDPYAVVKLVWASKKETDWEKELMDAGCTVVSGVDFIRANSPTRKYGLYQLSEVGRTEEGDFRKMAPEEGAAESGAEETEELCMIGGRQYRVINLAAPMYQWGRYYELLLRKMMDGSMDSRKTETRNQAVNFWWGMSAGVVDVILSDDLPYESRKAVGALRRLVINQAINPFEGEIRTRDGILKGPDSHRLHNKEVITMNWLCDNVIGEIPDTWELQDTLHETVKASGVKENP